ncbi:hypothetical protein BH09PAT3_BH09PAT3_0790 [soil metagenome]
MTQQSAEAYNEAIKFSVPYDWGVIRVTHEAADAYGLAPLKPNQCAVGDYRYKNGNADQATTDIQIIGPTEIAEVRKGFGLDDQNMPDSFTVQSITTEGVDLLLGLGKNEHPDRSDCTAGDLAARPAASRLAELICSAASDVQTSAQTQVELAKHQELRARMQKACLKISAWATFFTVANLDNEFGVMSLSVLSAKYGIEAYGMAKAADDIRIKLPKLLTGDPNVAYGSLLAKDFHKTFQSGIFLHRPSFTGDM